MCGRLLFDGADDELPDGDDDGDGDGGGEAAVELLDVHDNLDGSYELRARPRRTGPTQLWILLNGAHVLGSPIVARVEAAAADARASLLLPPEEPSVVAGSGAPLLLLLRDTFRNRLSQMPDSPPLSWRVELVSLADGSSFSDAAARARGGDDGKGGRGAADGGSAAVTRC